jgi:ABC-type lipoprotein release transport system permease subunit
VALVFSLFVVGVSLALAAAESKDERDILTIAGAPPGALARSAGARAWLMAVIGALMAVPVGFLPVVVVSSASGRNDVGVDAFPIVFPTRTVLLLVAVVPLTVCGVAWLASTTAQRLRPVRISTATFE